MSTDKGNNQKSRKKLPKYISEDVISTILDKAKHNSYRDYIILLTFWRTGMRLSEVSHLRKCDIRDHTIEVRNGKGGKDRIIPLERELGTLLGMWSDRMKHNEELFKIKERQIQNIVRKYSPPHVHAHTIRHSFAVHCLKHGMNIRSLQKILGHNHISTTEIYLDLIGKDIQDDFDGVSW